MLFLLKYPVPSVCPPRCVREFLRLVRLCHALDGILHRLGDSMCPSDCRLQILRRDVLLARDERRLDAVTHNALDVRTQ